jgi:hypothetical protein
MKQSACIEKDLFDDDRPPAGEEPDAADWEALFEYSALAHDTAVLAGMSELPVEADISRYVQKVLAAAREAEAFAGRTGEKPSEKGQKNLQVQQAAREAADRAATDRGDPAVRAVFAAAFKVDREIERMKGMLRFSPGEDGLYLARCAPDHGILPALAGHFKSRFGESPWAIIDEKRGVMLIRLAGEEPRLGVCCASRINPLKIAGQAIFYPTNSESSPDNRDFSGFFNEKARKTYKCNRLTEPAAPGENGDQGEDGWESLWRTYHRSINIENRKNEELQKRFMPLRYWKYLTELKDRR